MGPGRGALRLLEVAAAAAVWVWLYRLNQWAFPFFEKSSTASWIFLPAAWRLIAVLVWGWRGALGLWIGTLITSAELFGLWSAASLLAAPMSAVAPLLAVGLMRRPLALRPDLNGFSAADLALLAALNAVCSASLHSIVFVLVGVPRAAPSDMFTMMIGDVLGTFLVLYALKLALAALPAR